MFLVEGGYAVVFLMIIFHFRLRSCVEALLFLRFYHWLTNKNYIDGFTR